MGDIETEKRVQDGAYSEIALDIPSRTQANLQPWLATIKVMQKNVCRATVFVDSAQRIGTNCIGLHVSNLRASLYELGSIIVGPVLMTADLEHVREHGALGEEVKDVQSRQAEAERL